MRNALWILIGVLLAIFVAVGTGIAFIKSAKGFSAKEKPSWVETIIARQARVLAIPRDAKNTKNPVMLSDQVIAEGLAHWADHCASCHANEGSGETSMGRGFYPPAPDMRLPTTQDLSDGELFYVIENGVRLTGMPAWGSAGHDGTDSWKLVHFIRHLPKLSFEEKREMERLNPKGPEEWEEQKQQEEFLKGEDR